jgi:3-oxoadipate enol-lactonase
MPTLSIRGADLHYIERGRGEPVVFAHGLLFNGRMFELQMNALEDRFRCIAYDHRGQGQSAITPSGYTMDELMDDAAELIRAVGAAPCHFVGFSMGGFVGLRLAARRPELVRSLTLIGSSAEPEPKVLKYRALGTVVRWLGVKPVVDPITRILFGKKFRTDPARRQQQHDVRRHLLSIRVAGELKALEGVLSRPAIVEELDRIRVPTLVIVGEQDAATTPAKSRRIHQAIAGSKLVIIPEAGHTSVLEEPESVNAALLSFLDENRASSAAG